MLKMVQSIRVAPTHNLHTLSLFVVQHMMCLLRGLNWLEFVSFVAQLMFGDFGFSCLRGIPVTNKHILIGFQLLKSLNGKELGLYIHKFMCSKYDRY